MKNLSLIILTILSLTFTSCKDKSEDPQPLKLTTPVMQTSQSEYYGKYLIVKTNEKPFISSNPTSDTMIIGETSISIRNALYDNNTTFPEKTINGVGYDIYEGIWSDVDSFVHTSSTIQFKKTFYNMVKDGNKLSLKIKDRMGIAEGENTFELLKVD